MKDLFEKLIIAFTILSLVCLLIIVEYFLISSLFNNNEVIIEEVKIALPASNGVKRLDIIQFTPPTRDPVKRLYGVEKQIETFKEVETSYIEYYYPTTLREDLRYYWYTTPFELTDEEFDMLCRVVSLESGAEPEESQMVIATTIRNSIESGLFGNTVYDIIYRPNFYEVMGWIWEANPSETTKGVVDKVFRQGIMACDKSVLYFRLYWYHQWNTCLPAFQIGTICFSYSTLVK